MFFNDLSEPYFGLPRDDLAGEEGFEPSHAGIKIQCLNQLGDSPTQVTHETSVTDKLTQTAQPRKGCTSKFLHNLDSNKLLLLV
jgi:hypothetical protein